MIVFFITCEEIVECLGYRLYWLYSWYYLTVERPKGKAKTMKYTVSYTEKVGKMIIVEADSEEEATEKVYEAVNNGFIELCMQDYIEDSGTVDDCYHSDSYDLKYYPTLEELEN